MLQMRSKIRFEYSTFFHVNTAVKVIITQSVLARIIEIFSHSLLDFGRVTKIIADNLLLSKVVFEEGAREKTIDNFHSPHPSL